MSKYYNLLEKQLIVELCVSISSHLPKYLPTYEDHVVDGDFLNPVMDERYKGYIHHKYCSQYSLAFVLLWEFGICYGLYTNDLKNVDLVFQQGQRGKYIEPDYIKPFSEDAIRKTLNPETADYDKLMPHLTNELILYLMRVANENLCYEGPVEDRLHFGPGLFSPPKTFDKLCKAFLRLNYLVDTGDGYYWSLKAKYLHSWP